MEYMDSGFRKSRSSRTYWLYNGVNTKKKQLDPTVILRRKINLIQNLPTLQNKKPFITTIDR